jgi:hypothetical protein
MIGPRGDNRSWGLLGPRFAVIPVHPSGLRGYTGRGSSSSSFLGRWGGLRPGASRSEAVPPRHPPKRGSFGGSRGASPWLHLILLQDLISPRETLVGKELLK